MAQVKVKHQVFVSSTYEDLRAERQEVMHALLELDCIPAGMELFPAASEDQWTLIKSVIDECDYYILILGGRYGSIAPDDMGHPGMGYTEMEYRYALERGKPVLSFLHAKPGKLPSDKTEQTDAGREKFQAFRTLVRQKLCKNWTTAAELGSVVSRGLVQLQRSHPTVGWVRGDQVPSEGASEEILSLRKEIDRLQQQLQLAQVAPPPETEDLVQGEEQIPVTVYFCFRPGRGTAVTNWQFSSTLTWNKIFYHVSPHMIDEMGDWEFSYAVANIARAEAWKSICAMCKKHGMEPESLSDFRVNQDDFQTIKVQFRAWGLIQQSQKARPVKDTRTFWTLTPHGDRVMTRLRAIRTKGAKRKRAS